MYACVRAHMEVSGQHQCFPSFSTLFYLFVCTSGCLTEPGAHSLARLTDGANQGIHLHAFPSLPKAGTADPYCVSIFFLKVSPRDQIQTQQVLY